MLMENIFKKLPPVHEIMESPKVTLLLDRFHIPYSQLKEWVNEELDLLRQRLKTDQEFEFNTREEFAEYITDQMTKRASKYHPYNLRRVINGTGTVLHTNLGRARLSDKAMEQVLQTSKYYSNLEYQIELGSRGSRQSILEDLLVKATGAESAMVVNNNAAAVYLILRALTKGAEVVVSRGELVEIGGSFRVSTIMEESDASLVEVGTTNKTHPYDYEDAVTDKTKMFMKVHTSNFKAVGFTSDVSVKQLTDIAKEKRDHSSIIVYEDLGSGSLFPFINEGIGDEPVVKQSIANGSDVISFSGDKLLGGPQSGIIAGKKEVIDKLKKHPLARVLRVDKMTLAALEATLYDYVYQPEKIREIPTVRDILKTKEDISRQVDEFIYKTNDKFETLTLGKEIDVSKVGGGTMPVEELPTFGLTVEKHRLSANRCETFLRMGNIPLISRIKDDRVFIDFRTVSADEVDEVKNRLIELDQEHGEG